MSFGIYSERIDICILLQQLLNPSRPVIKLNITAHIDIRWTIFRDRPWISPCIKSTSNEWDIPIHVIASQLPGHCDVISNRLWLHQQNENRASETRGWCQKIVVLSSFMDSLCRVWNKIMYVRSWRTGSVLTRVLCWCLFPELRRNSGNKQQNDHLVSAETVRHSSTYINFYILITCTWRIEAEWRMCASVN